MKVFPHFMDLRFIAMTDSAQRANILFVVQRLSDFVEMRRAAAGLKHQGHRCIILFCGVGSKLHDDLVLESIDKSLEAQEIDEKIVFSEPKVVIETPVHKLVDYVLKKKALNATQSTIEQLPHIVEVASAKTQIEEKVYKSHRAKISSIKKGVVILRNIVVTLRNIIDRSINEISSFYKRPIRAFKRMAFARLKDLLVFLNKITGSSLVVVPVIYRKKLVAYEEILKQHQIKLIILPEDIVGSVSPLLIKAGHRYNIPSMIIPYTIANQSEAFQALKDRPEFSLKGMFSHRLLGMFFPSWVMKDDFHAALRLPAPHVLGHLVTRSSPPDPWMMNSTYANIIAVENEQMLRYYKKNGIPASKLRITGACYDDNLAYFLLDKTKQREKLYAELNINSTKPFLLIGGFPNQLTGGTPPGFDFRDAEEAVDFIADCLDRIRAEYEIIFRPHPNYLGLGDLFAKRNFLVTQIDTARLVALSDIYIAFASATIRWAISCGVPTINYDIFYYDFSDYKQVKGVLNVCAKEDFKNAVQTISEPEQLLSLKNHLDTEKLEWGYLDGGSISRINSLVKELLQAKKVRRKAS
ncbi:hypothetical protein [Legionella cardiaca]|uniref:Capsule polysaccharide biosynthesis protein n=1 Tax=Legionella cardiaca TaxID=1071983 RepID=A0ABY8AQ64_9GAMM|nr:hypothetical protein [Legionella cardiaca]WED41911.1 hypothetical protein PXX05_08175 [Legionella cardiaca]